RREDANDAERSRGPVAHRSCGDRWHRRHGKLGRLLQAGGRRATQPRALVRQGRMKLDSRPVFDIQKEIESRGIEVVRFAFTDQHGILRGKTVAAAAVGAALENGVGFPSSLLLKDTSNKSVFPVFTEGAGVGVPE